MRNDTHARLTLALAFLVGLVPVRSWERGEIDTATMAIRLAGAMAVTWAVLLLVSRVVAGYRSGWDAGAARAPRPPRRRAADRGHTPPPMGALADRDA